MLALYALDFGRSHRLVAIYLATGKHIVGIARNEGADCNKDK